MRKKPTTERELAMQREMNELVASITNMTGLKQAAISRAIGYGETKVCEVCRGLSVCSANLLAATRDYERRCREAEKTEDVTLAVRYQELRRRYDALVEDHRKLTESYRLLAERLLKS